MTKYGVCIATVLILLVGCATTAQRTAEIEAALRAKLEAERQQQKVQEIEQRVAMSRELFENFERKNHIVDWPKSSEFQANPFVHEHYNIAIKTTFRTMITPTQGVVGADVESMILVSDIPKGLFVKVSTVLLVGTVLGKEYAKIPPAGEVLVPHLKFVDAYICKNSSCDTFFFWKNKAHVSTRLRQRGS